MMAEGEIPKSLYFKLFHMTCVVHLLHNRPLKFKMHFEDVNKLVFLVGWSAGRFNLGLEQQGTGLNLCHQVCPY